MSRLRKPNVNGKNLVDGSESEDDDNEDGGFEYYLTLPSPYAGNSLPSEDDAAKNLHSQPAVILLGWMGCQDRYLMKYSQFYERESIASVRFPSLIPNLKEYINLFESSSHLDALAARIVNLIVELDLHRQPIFFHVFSNSGFMILTAISRFLERKQGNVELDVRGVIFDCCPSVPGVRGRYRAFMKTMPPHLQVFLVRCIVISVILLRSSWYKVYHWFRLALSSLSFGLVPYTPHYPYAYYSHSRYWLSRGCRELYLYTAADLLVPAAHVEWMIARRRALAASASRGTFAGSSFAALKSTGCEQISCERFEDAEHVAILRKSPERYIRLCLDLISSCTSSL